MYTIPPLSPKKLKITKNLYHASPNRAKRLLLDLASDWFCWSGTWKSSLLLQYGLLAASSRARVRICLELPGWPCFSYILHTQVLRSSGAKMIFSGSGSDFTDYFGSISGSGFCFGYCMNILKNYIFNSHFISEITTRYTVSFCIM